MPEDCPTGLRDDVVDVAHPGAASSDSDRRLFETVQRRHAAFGPGQARLLVLAVVGGW